MIQVEGNYQYPGRAARADAHIQLAGQSASLTLTTPEGASVWFSLSQITISDALGSIPLTLTFPDGGRFVPHDDILFRRWLAQHQRPGLVYRLESHKRVILLSLAALVTMVLCYAYVLLPWASAALAQHIPTAIEQRVGEHTMALLEHSEFNPSSLSAERQRQVRRLFDEVMPQQMRQDRTPLRLKLVDAPIGPNAFMLADGTLVVSDELVRLARNDDGLAAVMLHEMGHHAHRHPMRMFVRSSLVSLTFMWITGDVSGVGDTLLQSVAFVHEMQFSREMEREADDWAIAEMRRQGRPLQAMLDIYGALEAQSDDGMPDFPDWLSTHPDMQKRLEAIRAQAERP